MAIVSERDVRLLLEQLDKAVARIQECGPRIAVVGTSGFGKSTLVNKCFGQDLARAGDGDPITEDFDVYPPNANLHMYLYDSKGFTIDDGEQKTRLKRFVQERLEAGQKDVSAGLHIVWFLVSVAEDRMDSQAICTYCNDVLAGVPVLVVLTKTDTKSPAAVDKMERRLRSRLPSNVKGVLRVAAEPKSYPAPVCTTDATHRAMGDDRDGFWNCRDCPASGTRFKAPIGLDELLTKTMDILPDACRDAFAAQVKYGLKVKNKRAVAIVAAATAVAYGVGWAPIPWSDSITLAVVQFTMIGSLMALYNIKSKRAAVVLGLPAAAGSVGLTVASTLKLIPGIGTIVGGVIDSTVAAGVTAALGSLAIVILYRIRQLIQSGFIRTQEELDEAFGSASAGLRAFGDVVRGLGTNLRHGATGAINAVVEDMVSREPAPAARRAPADSPV